MRSFESRNMVFCFHNMRKLSVKKLNRFIFIYDFNYYCAVNGHGRGHSVAKQLLILQNNFFSIRSLRKTEEKQNLYGKFFVFVFFSLSQQKNNKIYLEFIFVLFLFLVVSSFLFSFFFQLKFVFSMLLVQKKHIKLLRKKVSCT